MSHERLEARQVVGRGEDVKVRERRLDPARERLIRGGPAQRLVAEGAEVLLTQRLALTGAWDRKRLLAFVGGAHPALEGEGGTLVCGIRESGLGIRHPGLGIRD